MTSATQRALALVLLAMGGMTIGWFLVRGRGETFDHVYPVLDPACMAAISVALLHRRAKQSRWLVPLLLLGAMLNVTIHPHEPVLAAIGFTAGAAAIIGTWCGYNRAAIVGTLLCCTSIAAASLAGMRPAAYLPSAAKQLGSLMGFVG